MLDEDQTKDAEVISSSGLFDPAFYVGKYSDLTTWQVDPLEHFILYGAAEGRDPHPLFDSAYYREQRPELANSKENLLLHFLRIGMREGTDPHPLFSTKFYTDLYADVRAGSKPPFMHYLRHGRKDLRRPHPLFDPTYYLKQHPQLVADERDLLVHYLTDATAGLSQPSEFFDPAFYLNEYADVKKLSINPLVHYVTRGATELRLPNKNFEPQFYIETYADVETSQMDPLTHYAVVGVAQKRVTNHRDFERQRDLKAAQAKLLAPPSVASGNIETLSFSAYENPEVSIIIPIYGQLEFTLRCLRSLKASKTSYSFEVIVVDDCSPDSSFDVLNKVSGLRLVRADKNGGFILSCNLGASLAKGRYLVFLNNDTEVLPNWLDELIGTFDLHPNAGMVGSQLLFPDGRVQEAGGVIYADGSAANFGRNDQFGKPEDNYVRSVDYCSGASLAISKELFHAVGDFDEHYIPAYCEDVDLAFQVRKAGRDVLYQPLSMVIHHEGVSSGTDIKSGVKAHQTVNLQKIKQRWANEIATHAVKGMASSFERDHSGSKKVLIVDSYTCKPDQDAGSALTFEWIEALKSWGYHCTYMPAQSFLHGGSYTEKLQRIGVKVIYPPYYSSPYEFLEKVGDAFDLVLIFRVSVFARHFDYIKKFCPSAKILFHTIDLHYLRYQREAEIQPSVERHLKVLDWKERELDAIKQSDCTIVVSSAEKKLLDAQLSDARVRVIPLSADISRPSTTFEQRRDIVFVGGFAHPPNVDAVMYFVNDILPLLRAHIPDIRFWILGAEPTKEVQSLASEHVVVTGFVENLKIYFDKSRLSVAPLRFGAGMKGKVLSSLAHGLPCVATTVAAEGIGLADGQTILIADASEAFAQQVVKLYLDERLWNNLSTDGLNFIEENYSKEMNKARLAEVLRELELDMRQPSGQQVRAIHA